HDYPNSIYGQPWFNDPSFPNNLPAKFDQMWGYIYKQNIAPVYLGEFGSRLSDPKDVAWLSKIKSYLNGDFDANGTTDIPAGQQGIDWTWWSWNPNSGDTGGILADDWNTPIQNKVTQLQPLMFDFDSGSPGGTTNGVTNAVFTVTLSAAATQAVTVGYQSVAGTADTSDFTPVSGTLTFAPGERTKTVTVKVAGDGQQEPNETFQLKLSSPNGATLLKGTATATIVNDDASTLAAAAAPAPAAASTLAAKSGAQIAATTVVTSDWGTGFSANVAVKNTGTEAVDAWTLLLKSPATIANIWNAQITSHDGDTYQLHNAGWNSVIVPGQEIVFGFEASGRPTGTFEWVI
ncbi:MAG: cellulose binding domain-containing protein, partial [Microvirga sp.]